ncbi:8201_t:CDS:2 [Entrophospora sp. SA101]|nr:8201_t:CDS:2 [Entrophospora sp. SA101]
MLKEFKQRLFLPHYVANLLFILPYLIIRYILPYDYLDISIELPEKRIYMIFTFLISLKYKTTGSLEDSKLRKKKNKIEEENEEYWIIFCYVSWSNVCRNFEPVVAETSLKNINFAKIDLEKYPAVADEYNISLSPSNFDIPTLLLLKNGDLISRLPQDPDTIINQNDQMKQLKSPLIKNIKVTWDRLGWGRDMWDSRGDGSVCCSPVLVPLLINAKSTGQSCR